LLPSQTLMGRIRLQLPSQTLVYALLLGSVLIAIVTVVAFTVRSCYAVTASGDILQFLLVAAVSVLFAKNAYASRGSARVFWSLLALSFAIWLASLAFWVYFEVWLKRTVPDLPVSDLLLFLKLAPLLLALALEPQKEDSRLSRILGFLDLSLLMVYWLYFYAFWVSVYRLIPYGTATYNFHYNAINAFGNQVVLIAAGFMALRSRGPWQTLYKSFFVSSAVYCLASDLSNTAIDRGLYYTGSLYDVPLVASLVGFIWIALFGAQIPLSAPSVCELPSTPLVDVKNHSYWTFHLGMIATLSTPVIGLYLLLSTDMHAEIRHYRILATLVSMLLLTILLTIKHDILSSHLARSLREISQSYSSLTRFKDQLLQSEKLVSLGQLVARVANEIRKAMEEILECVADLTANSRIDAAALLMTSKIGHYASRTNVLVESMLSFARETPPQKISLNVNALVERALSLSRAAKNCGIRGNLELDPEIPSVYADPGQLLQVFMHVISNAVDAMEGLTDNEFRISTKLSGDRVIIEFADSGTGLRDLERVFEPFYSTKAVGKGTGLGLSTCYGIVHSHGGEITCRNRPAQGAIFTVALPCEPLGEQQASPVGQLSLGEER
jgi:signal transduction histidine kinase